MVGAGGSWVAGEDGEAGFVETQPLLAPEKSLSVLPGALPHTRHSEPEPVGVLTAPGCWDLYMVAFPLCPGRRPCHSGGDGSIPALRSDRNVCQPLVFRICRWTSLRAHCRSQPCLLLGHKLRV